MKTFDIVVMVRRATYNGTTFPVYETRTAKGLMPVKFRNACKIKPDVTSTLTVSSDAMNVGKDKKGYTVLWIAEVISCKPYDNTERNEAELSVLFGE